MHSVLVTCRNVGFAICFAGLGYGGYRYAIHFGNVDPFAKFRGIEKINMQAGIQLDNVDLRAYKDGVLQAKAQIGTATVTQSRDQLEMTKITDGVYRGETPINFASDRATYNIPLQSLQLRGNAILGGKDFHLQTMVANINRTDQTLEVPVSIQGRLFGGDVKAASFSYQDKTGTAEVTEGHWQGKPPAQPDLQDEPVSHTWSIDSDHSFGEKATGNYTFLNCKATDGVCLIYAPKAIWNRKTDVLTGSGRITYYSGKADLIADSVVVYRKEKRAVFTGNVYMLVKPKKQENDAPKKEDIPPVATEKSPDKIELPKDQSSPISQNDKDKAEQLRSGKNFREFPLHVQAQEITYWYAKGSRHAEFNGDPVARQDFPNGQWRIGWSDHGTYDGEKEMLNLESKSSDRTVRYKNSMGDLALAKAATFSTQETESEDDNDVDFTDASGLYKDVSGEDERSGKDKSGGSNKPPNVPTNPTNPAMPPTGPAGTPSTPPEKHSG